MSAVAEQVLLTYVLAGQTVQGVGWLEPTGHQEPVVQELQAVAPVVGMKVPSSQGSHGWPLAGPKVPGTHVQLSIEVAPSLRVSELVGQALTVKSEHEVHKSHWLQVWAVAVARSRRNHMGWVEQRLYNYLLPTKFSTATRHGRTEAALGTGRAGALIGPCDLAEGARHASAVEVGV